MKKTQKSKPGKESKSRQDEDDKKKKKRKRKRADVLDEIEWEMADEPIQIIGTN